MRYYKKITVLAALAVAAVGQMFAQNQSSPYSRYGYGLFSDYATSAQRNMGGVGVAMADGRQINVMNPASYAATDSLTLHWDIGLDLTQLKSSEEGNSGKAFGGGLNYLTLQFPITKYMGASIGLVPYTTVGYSFGNSLKADDGTVQTSQSTSVSGYGGIDELYIGLGARPVRGLTLGANFSYQFGTIVNDQYVISSTSTLYEQKIQVRDWNVLLGLQYTQRLAPKHQLTFGFTYSPKKDFHGRTWGVKYDMSGDVSSTSGAAKPDTIANERLQTMGYSKPNAYAFGLNYNFDQRLSAEVDFSMQQWSKATFPGLTNEDGNVMYQTRLDDRWRIAAGVQYVPRMRGSYLQRVAYRLGGSYTRDYLMIGDNHLKEFGVSCGFGFPTVAQKTVINLGFEYKRRKAYPASLVTENYFNITLGINFKEFAFWKEKIR